MKNKGKLDKTKFKVPSIYNWNTTDTDEINRRRLRAQTESFRISNLDGRFPIFSNFLVKSGSGLSYTVEIRDLNQQQFGCTCVDFRINGLGTCKHVEAVLNNLQARYKRLFKSAVKKGSPRIEIVPDAELNTLRVIHRPKTFPRALRARFDKSGVLRSDSVEQALAVLRALRDDGLPELRLSLEIEPWLTERRHAEERIAMRREYEINVQNGKWPMHETLLPLFPYQREGMLHLAFTERALLADEMGLGKTIQAIAACALLKRLGKAHRVLVITPASLKTEWEEQIQRFTELPLQIVFGNRGKRLATYQDAPFFTVANYEQMLRDALDVNQYLKPDIVVLDEAQRIKNWSAKTTQAIKRLRSRFAFILTGTPIENRIDEIYSLMDFLNPSVLGPLFRFNRDFYQLDDRGRPAGYRNLDQLHTRIKPLMLRRTKANVETELPDRTDRNHFVPLSQQQRESYIEHEMSVARLVHVAKRRPLKQQEQDKLMRELAMMRMVCDTNYILDPSDTVCPKLKELEKLLEECRDNELKVLVFSEWERMLRLVRDLCEKMNIGFAWHTGTVPQRRRRGEINAFKNDSQCRVFLSTDSGSTGLNLQNASVVINCDLPWNPAKLEQRIARAWRKHQTRAVTVINLVSEDTIEHRMLGTLADKTALSKGVLEMSGDLKEIKLRSGKQAFLARLEQVMTPTTTTISQTGAQAQPLPADRALAFSRKVSSQLGSSLVRCEERYPNEGEHSVLVAVVEKDTAYWKESIQRTYDGLFANGKNDPLAEVRLEIIDRATYDAVERLIAAGLMASTTRTTRSLHPIDDLTEPKPLSPNERKQVESCRQDAARKLKMGTVLSQSDLLDEGRSALLQSIFSVGRAFAIENRLPEPTQPEEALSPPLSLFWSDTLSTLRDFVTDPSQPWQPAVERLDRVVGHPVP